MFSSVGSVSSGSRSAIDSPYPSRPARLEGLFVSSRIERTPEVDEDLRPDAVVAGVRREPELHVRLDGVAALLLELVGPQLVREPDRAALVSPDVEHHAATLLARSSPCARRAARRSRIASIRTRRRSSIPSARGSARRGRRRSPPARARRASGRRRGSRRRRTGTRRTGVGIVASATRSTSFSRWRRYSMRSAMEMIFRPCSRANRTQFGQPRHRAVVVHHLAEHAGRVQARQPREIHGRLGVPGALRAPRPRGSAAGRCGPGGRDPPAPVAGSTIGTDRRRAVGSARCPCVTPRRASIETVNAVSPKIGVRRHHQRDVELVQAIAEHRHADHPARMAHDERDRLGRGLLRRHDQIALVLTVGVVDHDHDAPVPDVLHRLLDGGEDRPASRRSSVTCSSAHQSSSLEDPSARSMYLAIMSTSRFTGSPGAAAPSVVTASVCGISATVDTVVVELGHRQAHAVDGDRALLDHVAAQLAAGTARPDRARRRRRRAERSTSPTPST